MSHVSQAAVLTSPFELTSGQSMTQSSDSLQRTPEFMRLFTQEARRIYAYILVLLPDYNAADDAFQEVSLTLWEKFAEFQSGSDFGAWAKQMAYYKVLQYRERKSRDCKYFGEVVVEVVAEEAAQMADALEARNRALVDCLTKLAPADRDLIERRYAPEARTETVAVELGRSIHSVYRSLRRIHQALHHCINRALNEETGR